MEDKIYFYFDRPKGNFKKLFLSEHNLALQLSKSVFSGGSMEVVMKVMSSLKRDKLWRRYITNKLKYY